MLHVPLAVLDILQLLICRDLMIRLQLNLPFRQQQVKDLVSILSALVTSNPYFSGSLLPKGHEIGFLLFWTHSAYPTIWSSSESELSEQSTKLTFFWKLLLFCSYGLASPIILWAIWLMLQNSWEAYFSLMCGKSRWKAISASCWSDRTRLKHRFLTSLNLWMRQRPIHHSFASSWSNRSASSLLYQNRRTGWTVSPDRPRI